MGGLTRRAQVASCLLAVVACKGGDATQPSAADPASPSPPSSPSPSQSQSPSQSPSPPPSSPSPAVDSPPTSAAEHGGQTIAIRTFSTAHAAISHVLASKPRIVGFGEFHQTTESAPVRPTLVRFTEAFDAVAAIASDLVVETWVEAGQCGKTEEVVSRDVKEVTRRPAAVENHLLALLTRAKERGIRRHVMPMTCEDYGFVTTAAGEVDYEKMLELIKRKLAEAVTRAWRAPRPAKTPAPTIAIYGGALHNDLYPYEGLESYSYAADVASLAGASYVEIDLYVPEFIAGNALLATEPWYPESQRRASPDHVLLIERRPRSYAIILRTGAR